MLMEIPSSLAPLPSLLLPQKQQLSQYSPHHQPSYLLHHYLLECSLALSAPLFSLLEGSLVLSAPLALFFLLLWRHPLDQFPSLHWVHLAVQPDLYLLLSVLLCGQKLVHQSQR